MPSMDASGKKMILVVDDSQKTRNLLLKFLTGLGYSVQLAESGGEAERLAQSERPELILMDLRMPVVDGFETSARIRSHAELSEVPILALSSSGRKGIELFSEREKLGPAYVGYITKPINLNALAEEISLVLSKTVGRDRDTDGSKFMTV